MAGPATRDRPLSVEDYFRLEESSSARDVVYYPDVMFARGSEGNDPLVEHVPCLVVEVISSSTEMIDRREKAMVYKGSPT
jgi:Uma2 family endonuclease